MGMGVLYSPAKYLVSTSCFCGSVRNLRSDEEFDRNCVKDNLRASLLGPVRLFRLVQIESGTDSGSNQTDDSGGSRERCQQSKASGRQTGRMVLGKSSADPVAARRAG